MSTTNDAWISSALAIAERDIGIGEQGGNNRGPQIDSWTKELGLPLGSPWCMIWIQHIFQRAANVVPHGPTPSANRPCLDVHQPLHVVLADACHISYQYDEIDRDLTWHTLSVDLPAWSESLQQLFEAAAAVIDDESG